MRELQHRSVDFFGMPKQRRAVLTSQQLAERKARRNEKARAARVAARDLRRASRLEVGQALQERERPAPLDWAPLMEVWP